MLMATKIDENLEHYLGKADVTALLPQPVSEWVMVIVKPGMEQEARDSLRRRGVGAWWPNYEKEIGLKDRQTGKRYKRIVASGVLPGVLLSPARLTEQFWTALDLAPGVVNVARKFSTEVIVLSDTDIVMIHKIEVGQSKHRPPSTDHKYTVGDRVRLIDDEFSRLPPGIVVRVSRDGRLTVEMNFFGGMQPVDVLPDQVRLVDAPIKNQSGSRSTDARDRPAKSPSRR